MSTEERKSLDNLKRHEEDISKAYEKKDYRRVRFFLVNLLFLTYVNCMSLEPSFFMTYLIVIMMLPDTYGIIYSL